MSGSSSTASPEPSYPSTPNVTLMLEDGCMQDETGLMRSLDKLELSEPSTDFLPIHLSEPDQSDQPEFHPRSLTFDLPPTRQRSCPRPGPPTRAKTAVGIVTGNGSASAPNTSPLLSPRPRLQRGGSGFFAGVGRSLSSTNLNTMLGFGFKSPKKGKTSEPSPELSTPEVQALFKNAQASNIPDLKAVNAALEALRLKDVPDDNPCLGNLATLALEIGKQRASCRSLLNDAMRDRAKDDREICRGKCIEIIHNQSADIETRVYAYNILSTLASPGQAMRFLKDAEKLIKDSESSHEELLGTVHMLMMGAKELDRRCKPKVKERARGEKKFELPPLEMVPSIPRLRSSNDENMPSKPAATPANLLKLAVDGEKAGNDDEDAVSPRMKTIMDWAAEELKERL